MQNDHDQAADALAPLERRSGKCLLSFNPSPGPVLHSSVTHFDGSPLGHLPSENRGFRFQRGM